MLPLSPLIRSLPTNTVSRSWPLTPHTLFVRPQASLSKITSLAAAFEVDLRGAQRRGHKERYVFICSSAEEAEQWRVAIGEQCTGYGDDEGGGRGAAGAAPRLPPLPPELLRAATSGEPEELEELRMAAGSAGIAE